ncbi:N4-gp56 family major capsid protein [Ferrovibrio sp.]|uniref:N4-gp56 family major capsid protein n=1 Tax=Ferrovibrio sp. TaxID=1917215 RepID=UPI00311ECAE3
MAQTDFGALTEAQKRIWAAEVWQAGRDQSFWFSMGFVGKNDADFTKPIQRVTKLTETERGTECVMQLVLDMQGDGVVGNNELTGNEEALVNDSQTIRIDHLRHGVKSKGSMAEQATVIRFRATAKEKLSFWLSDKVDELGFLTIAGRAYSLKTDGSSRGSSQLTQLSFASDVAAASSNRILYAGSATSEGTLTTSDTVGWNYLVTAKTKAERKRIKPIRDGGKNYYCVVLSTEQMRDLLKDSTYQTIVSRAGERGSKNPLFMNATAVVQGLVIYSHAKVYNTLGLTSGVDKWGSGQTVDGAQGMLLGSSAMGLATIGSMQMAEADQNDYGDKPGIAVGRKFGLLKPQFKSVYDSNAREDFGVISLKTAAAA